MELNGNNLTPEQLARAVTKPTQVSLAPEARQRNAHAYAATLKLAAQGAHVYGLSTGVGALKTERVSQQADFPQRLLRSHAGGTGDVVSPRIARATVLTRINQLAAGGAGVHPDLLDALVALFNSGDAPRLRTTGAVGTGDLTSLAELGLSLIGERPLASGSTWTPAPLGPRDGLMLMSSNAHTIAEAALACEDLKAALEAADTCAALTYEAARANPSALDPRVHAARPHPGQILSAERIRTGLLGASWPAPRLQDSLAFRCLPQVHGALHDAHGALERVLCIELNAAAENALLVDGEALPNGNFHAIHLALALDHARNALAQITSLGASRVGDLLNPETTGLSAFLALNPGPDSGLMILEYVAHDAAAEILALAAPVGRGTSLSRGVENHASFANIAARNTTRAIPLLFRVIACELVAAVRIFRMRKDVPQGRGNHALFERAAKLLSAELEDRPLSRDLEQAEQLVRAQSDL